MRTSSAAPLRVQHGGHLGTPNPLTQRRCRRAVATQAQRADVQKVALAAALHHRHNVVGVPQALAQLRFQTPVRHQLQPALASGPPQPPQFKQRIRTAAGAHALVPHKNLVAQVCRLGPQPPLVHAVRRAEREAPRRHLQRAPAAQAAPVRPARHLRPLHAATLHHARRAHLTVVSRRNRDAKCRARNLRRRFSTAKGPAEAGPLHARSSPLTTPAPGNPCIPRPRANRTAPDGAGSGPRPSSSGQAGRGSR